MPETFANLLARAEVVARFAHQHQVDKNDRPYVEHLQAVADGCTSRAAKIVAWLHDIVEDTPMSLDDLRTLGFGGPIVDAVGLLTHYPEVVPHDDYVRVIRDAPGIAGELAREVKRADLAHNADPARTPPGHEKWVAKRYGRSIDILEGRVP